MLITVLKQSTIYAQRCEFKVDFAVYHWVPAVLGHPLLFSTTPLNKTCWQRVAQETTPWYCPVLSSPVSPFASQCHRQPAS